MKRALILEPDFQRRCRLVQELSGLGLIPDVVVSDEECGLAVSLRDDSSDSYALAVLPLSSFDGSLAHQLRACCALERPGSSEATRIVVTASDVSRGSVLRAFRSGCDGFVPFPWTDAASNTLYRLVTERRSE